MGRGLTDAEILQLPRSRKVRGGIEERLARREAAEAPAMTEVRVSSFLIGRHPVTQGEWVEVTGKNPSRFKDPLRPVEMVTWTDAVEYCNERSYKEDLTPCYAVRNGIYHCDFSADGYRLPTEAEWEYAARGGPLTRGYIFPGSDDVDLVAWHARNAGDQTHRVGQKLANELGLFDLAGNVNELCWDWYEPNTVPAAENPEGPSRPVVGNKRAVKGCCFKSSPHLMYIGYRIGRGMNVRNDHLGFRVVRTCL